MDKSITLTAPKVVCLYREDYAVETTHFIQQIYDTSPGQSVILDFSKTKDITAAACVVLFAHINRMQCFPKQARRFDVLPKKSKRSKQVQLLAKAISMPPSPSVRHAFGDGQRSMFICGVKPAEGLELIEQFFRNIDAPLLAKNNITFSYIQTAIREALLNVNHHAYLGNTSLQKRWWGYLAYSNGSFFFDVCDLGVGMVKSYLESKGRSGFSIFHTKADILRELLKPGVTRYDNPLRGQGLPDVVRPSDIDANVTLWLITNNLCLQRSKNLDNCRELTYNLPCTIVEWIFDTKKD